MHQWLTDLAKDYGSLPSAGAVVVSGLIAIGVALYTIATNRGIARRKATLDLIIMSETADFFRRLTVEFNAIRDENQDGISSVIPILTKRVARFKRDFDPDNPLIISKEEGAAFKTVQSYLNYYELIAVGMDNRILDEKFYRNWMQSNYISTWERSEALVLRWRELMNYDQYFCRMEFYTRKWRLTRFQQWRVGRNKFRLIEYDASYRPPIAR